MNELNFEKMPYGGLQEQAGASRVRRQANISLKSLYYGSSKNMHEDISLKIFCFYVHILNEYVKKKNMTD